MVNKIEELNYYHEMYHYYIYESSTLLTYLQCGCAINSLTSFRISKKWKFYSESSFESRIQELSRRQKQVPMDLYLDILGFHL